MEDFHVSKSSSLADMEDDQPSPLSVLSTDGPRLSNVKVSCQETLQKIFAEWKPTVIQKCYKNPACQPLLEAIQKSALDAAQVDIEKGLSDIIRDELEPHLKNLSSLVSNSQLRKNEVAWRPTGDPLLDVCTTDVKSLERQKEYLRELVNKEALVTAELKEEVKRMRHKINDNHTTLRHGLSATQRLSAVCDEAAEEDLQS